jgi:hypothetical protein
LTADFEVCENDQWKPLNLVVPNRQLKIEEREFEIRIPLHTIENPLTRHISPGSQNATSPGSTILLSPCGHPEIGLDQMKLTELTQATLSDCFHSAF